MGTVQIAQVTDDALFSVLKFCQAIFPGVPCVFAQENDVPPPEPPYVMANAVATKRLSTNRHVYTATQEAIIQPVQVQIQIDFFGPDAQSRQAMFTTLWRDDFACRWFSEQGFPVAPLYTEDRQFSSYVNESEMYEQRWLCDAFLQIDQTIVIDCDTANQAGPVGLIEVDTGAKS